MTLIKIDSYTSSSIVSDVSYDIYFGSAATGQVSYEVMIWLATNRRHCSDVLHKQAIATLSIAGTSFQPYKGSHGGDSASTIFTFVANSE
jgi:xyloglucan-specific endo-beta-1,4-glucanase